MSDVLVLFVGLPTALILGLALPAVIWLLYHRMGFGLLLALGTYLLEMVLLGSVMTQQGMKNPMSGVDVGITLFPADMIFMPMALAGALRLVFLKEEVPNRSNAWLLFGVFLVVSFALGFSQFGKTAASDFRATFHYWACAFYFMTFPINETRTKQLVYWWLVGSGLLFGLACFRWFATFAGIPLDYQDPSPTWGKYRVVHSIAALYFAQALMISIYLLSRERANRWIWVSVPVLLCTVLVLQHRSVWVATAAGIVTLYIVFPGKLRLKLAQPMMAAGVLVVALTLVLAGYGKLGKLTDSMEEAASAATDLDRGSVGGRIYGWQQLLISMEPQHYIVGQPFGTSYARYEGPRAKKKVEYSPHNLYVEILVRTGVIGLSLWLVAYFGTMRRLLAISDSSEEQLLPARLVFVLLVIHLVYFVPYSHNYVLGVWLGVALSIVASSRRDDTPSSRQVYVATQAKSYGPTRSTNRWRGLLER